MIQIIKSSKDDAIAFEVNGRVTKDDIRKLALPVEAVVKSQGNANALMVVNNFQGFTLSSFFEDLRFGLKHMKDFDKIAVVGDKKWLETLVKIESYFPKVNIKYFDTSEAREAWGWLG